MTTMIEFWHSHSQELRTAARVAQKACDKAMEPYEAGWEADMGFDGGEWSAAIIDDLRQETIARVCDPIERRVAAAYGFTHSDLILAMVDYRHQPQQPRESLCH